MGGTILIIEASMLLEHLVRYLEVKDWRIHKIREHKEIRRLLKQSPIDVVLLNLSDLKNEGITLINMIKKITPETQVITINSGDQIHLSIEGMKLGVFYDFIMPLDVDSLITKIVEACQFTRES
ncbi:MAG: response regulator [Candidatus Magnetomorum sp.]|nr:response regulator [Candidatus Magnetomorum sp.]